MSDNKIEIPTSTPGVRIDYDREEEAFFIQVQGEPHAFVRYSKDFISLEPEEAFNLPGFVTIARIMFITNDYELKWFSVEDITENCSLFDLESHNGFWANEVHRWEDEDEFPSQLKGGFDWFMDLTMEPEKFLAGMSAPDAAYFRKKIHIGCAYVQCVLELYLWFIEFSTRTNSPMNSGITVVEGSHQDVPVNIREEFKIPTGEVVPMSPEEIGPSGYVPFVTIPIGNEVPESTLPHVGQIYSTQKTLVKVFGEGVKDDERAWYMEWNLRFPDGCVARIKPEDEAGNPLLWKVLGSAPQSVGWVEVALKKWLMRGMY